jgi:hypothetical protein
MEQSLLAYDLQHDPAQLRQFESLRKTAAAGEGITAFWNALLNIRLNSVPLLDPSGGITGSIAACNASIKQITGSLSA